MTHGQPMVTATGVEYRYPGAQRPVVSGVSFTVSAGETVCLMGASGSGKTTLLNLLAGILTPSAGAVVVETPPPSRLGYIFQNDALLPWRSVGDNLVLSNEINQLASAPEARQRAVHYLSQFGLAPTTMGVFPSALSGGMRQRVAIIQTLMGDPTIMLLDEPFGSLDLDTKLVLERDFLHAVRSGARCSILVTHDIAEAVAIADRVLLLGGSPARILAEVPLPLAERYRDPELARSAPEFSSTFQSVWKALRSAMAG